MNEEALDVLFGLAKGDGYKKGKKDFALLMSENEAAVDRMFILAKGDGYKKGKEDFKTLVGFGSNVGADPQKKNQSPAGLEPLPQEEDLQSVSATSPSVSSAPEPPKSVKVGEVDPSTGQVYTQEDLLRDMRRSMMPGVAPVAPDASPFARQQRDLSERTSIDFETGEVSVKPIETDTPAPVINLQLSPGEEGAERSVQLLDPSKGYDELKIYGSDELREGELDIAPGFLGITSYASNADRASFGQYTPEIEELLLNADNDVNRYMDAASKEVLASEEMQQILRSSLYQQLSTGNDRHTILPDELANSFGQAGVVDFFGGDISNTEIGERLATANREAGLSGEDALGLQDFFFDSQDDAKKAEQAILEYGNRDNPKRQNVISRIKNGEPVSVEEKRSVALANFFMRGATDYGSKIKSESPSIFQKALSDGYYVSSSYGQMKKIGAVEGTAETFKGFEGDQEGIFDFSPRSSEDFLGSVYARRVKERFESEYKFLIDQDIRAAVPEEVASNEDILDALDTKIWQATGIGFDISGDNFYQEKPWLKRLADNVNIGAQSSFGSLGAFAETVVTLSEDPLIEAAEKRAEFSQRMRYSDQQMTSRLAQGDFSGAFSMAGDVVQQAIPQLALAATPVGTVGQGVLMGFSSGAAAYGDISIDPRFSGMSTWEKVGYSTQVGALNALTQGTLARISKGTMPSISGRVGKYVDSLLRPTFKTAQKNALTRVATGYALRMGYGGSVEGTAEAVTEFLLYNAEVNATGEEWNWKDANERMLMGFAGGLGMGTPGAAIGIVSQAYRNAANSFDERARIYQDHMNSAEITDLNKQLESNTTKGEDGVSREMTNQERAEKTKRRDELVEQREKDAVELQQKKEPFFRMLRYRHREAFDNIQQKKNEITALFAKSKDPNTSDSQKAEIKKQIDQKMAEIQDIESLYRQEDLKMTNREKANYFLDASTDTADKLSSLIEEEQQSLAAMEQTLEAMEDIADLEQNVLGVPDSIDSDSSKRIKDQKKAIKEKREAIERLNQSLEDALSTQSDLSEALAQGSPLEIKSALDNTLGSLDRVYSGLAMEADVLSDQEFDQEASDLERSLTDVFGDQEVVEEEGDVDYEKLAKDRAKIADDADATIELGKGGFVTEEQLVGVPEELRSQYADIINSANQLIQDKKVIILDPETAAKLGMKDTIGRVEGDRVYINPARAVSDKQKSFKAHVVEEVLHTHVTEKWRALDIDQQIKLLNEALDIFSDVEGEFESIRDVMLSKIALYNEGSGFGEVITYNTETNKFELAEGVTKDQVNKNADLREQLSFLTEEAAFEPLLKYAEDGPLPSSGVLAKIKSFFNNLFGKGDAFNIKGSEDLKDLAQGFRDAFAGRKVDVKLETKSEAEADARSRESKAERKIRNSSEFIVNDNGEVELFFFEKDYTGISRVKSVTAKNPVHAGHLINKITNGGTNPKVNGFYQSVKTDSGFQDTYVDVDSVIKNRYRKPRMSKASGQDFFLGKKMRATQRIDAAYDQGLINKPERNRMLSNLNGLERLYNGAGRYFGGTDVESPKFKRADALLDQFESKSAAFFAKRARDKDTTFFFGPDARSGRSSKAAQILVTDKKQIPANKFEEALSELLCGKGVKTCRAFTKIMDHQKLQTLLFAENPELLDPNLSEEERTSIATETLIQAFSAQLNLEGWMDEHYGGVNPLDFYTDTESAIEDLFKRAVMTGQIGKMTESNLESFKVVANLMLAITSQVNTASRNVLISGKLAFEAHKNLESSARQTDSGIIAGNGLIAPSVIADLRKLKKGDKTDSLAGLAGVMAREVVAGNLEKANLLFAGESVVGSDGKTYKLPKSVLKTDPDAGIVVDSEAFFEYMNQKNPETGEYNAQMIFGHKIGAFFLNLGGNLDVITIDTHVLRSLALYRGEWAMWDTEIDRVIGTFLSGDISSLSKAEIKLAKEAVKLSGIEGNAIDPKDVVRKLIEIGAKKDADKPYRERSRETEIVDTLIHADAKDINLTPERRASLNKMVTDLAEYLTERNGEGGRVVKPAEAMQMIFADHQVFSFGYSNASRYTPFGEAINQVIEDRSFFTSGLRESIDISDEVMNKDVSYSGAVISGAVESFGEMSQQVEDAAVLNNHSIISPSNGQPSVTNNRIQAEDSRTYRSRRTKPAGVRKQNIQVLTNVDLTVDADKSNAALFSVQEGISEIKGDPQEFTMKDVRYDGVLAVLRPESGAVFTDVESRPIKSASEATVIDDGSGIPKVILRGEIVYAEPNTVPKRKPRESRASVDPEMRQDAIETVKAFAEANGILVNAEAVVGRMNDADARELVNSPQGRRARESRASNNAEQQLRGTVNRTVGKFSSATRAKMLANKKSYFKPESLKNRREQLDTMTDDQLVQELTDYGLERASKGDDPNKVFKKEDSFAVLAGIERINRAINQGNDQDALDIMEELAAMGTTAGRILRYLQELKHIDPDFLYKQLRLQIDDSGAILSDAQDSKLKAMTNAFNAAKDAYMEAREKAANLGTKEAEAELRRADKSFAIVKRDLNTFMNSMVPGAWGRVIQQNIQGNLLVVKSHVVNVGTNLFRALGFIAYNTMAHPIERIINKLGGESKNKRSYSLMAYIDGIRYARRAGRILKEDILEGLDPDRRSEWRMERGLKPVQALLKLFGRGDTPIYADGIRGRIKTVDDVLKTAFQAILGIPANINFKLLTAGDIPFRMFGEGVALAEMGRARGLRGEALRQFMMFPPKDAALEAQKEGARLTFQEETTIGEAAKGVINSTVKFIGGAINKIPGFGRGKFFDGEAFTRFIFRAANLPYLDTPAAIANEVLTFSLPPYAVARMLKDARAGDSRKAAQHLAKAILGGVTIHAALYMIKHGLMTGATDWEDDEERNIRGGTFHAQAINVSKLRRHINGEDDGKYHKDDLTIQYPRLGVIGAILASVAASTNKEELKNRDLGSFGGAELIRKSLGVDASSATSAMLDQTFMQGMEGLLKALASNNEKQQESAVARYFGTMFNAVSASVLPNQFASLTRYNSEYAPVANIDKDATWEEQTRQRIEHTLKLRTFNTEGMLPRIDIKGNPIPSTPEGSNPIVYHFFDPTKASQGSGDPVDLALYSLYEDTGVFHTVYSHRKIYQDVKNRVPSFPRGRKGKLAVLMAEKKTGRKYTFFNDPDFYSESYRRLLPEDRIEIAKALNSSKHRDLTALIQTQEYISATPQARLSMLDEIDESYKSALEMDGPRFRDYSIVVLDAFQNLYEEIYGEE